MSRGQKSIEVALLEQLPTGSGLLLAVSGGVDSMVLLHACSRIARQRKLRLEVAHLDHGLRRESAGDARFVRSYAGELGLASHQTRAKPPRRLVNLEEWGRDRRYRFFERVRVRRNLDFIVTAHQANDLAETLLMKLVSNKEPHLISAVDPERKLLRPLLSVSRREIERYACEHGVPWREDSSNGDNRFLRNRIRNLLLPLLIKEFDPRIVEVLAVRAASLGEDQRLLYQLAASSLEKLSSDPSPFNSKNSKNVLRELKKRLRVVDRAVAWRAVELLLLERLGFRIGRKHASAALRVILGEVEAVELPGGGRLSRSALHGLQLRRHSPASRKG